MAAAYLLAALALGPVLADTSGNSGSPYYTADSIANTAANVTGLFAPNTFITIYGQGLAYTTRAMSPDDLQAGQLPTALIGTGLRVLINNIAANIYYVSPTQVNLLIPASLIAGPATLQLVVNGLAGPAVSITLTSAAPALFQSDAKTALSAHADGSLITAAAPAHAGEEIVLYATGLGTTNPAAIPNQIAQQAARLDQAMGFSVLLNGAAVDPQRIDYAGVTPGFAGLYQINVRLPDNAPSNPEIQLGSGNILSPAARFLPLQ